MTELLMNNVMVIMTDVNVGIQNIIVQN